MAEEEGLYYLSPYDDEAIVRGNATMATEIMLQLSRQEEPDKRYVHGVHIGVGGGGALSGLGDVNAELGGIFDLYGAEPEGANSGTRSFESGKIVELEADPDTTAEGLAVQALGKLAHQRILEGKVTDIRTVSLASVGQAYYWYISNVLPQLGVNTNEEHEVWDNMPEVSAMVALAETLEHAQDENVANESHLVVITGGNTDRSKAEATMAQAQLLYQPA